MDNARTDPNDLFQRFANQKRSIMSALKVTADAFEYVDRIARARDMQSAMQNLESERFRIVVFGPMKRGKSTLINALLSESLLPTLDGTSCTAIPTVVRHGSVRRAVGVARETLNEVGIEWQSDTKTYAKAITTGRTLDGQSLHEVRLELDTPICEKGVELVDTPGINEWAEQGRTRADAAWEMAKSADSVILVWTSASVGVIEDTQVLDLLLSKGLDPRVVFITINHAMRNVISPDSRERWTSQANAIMGLARVPHDHLSIVRALDALEARTTSNAEREAASGIQELERQLGRFLSKYRALGKLLTPLQTAEYAIEEALSEVDASERSRVAAIMGGISDASQRAAAAYENAKQHSEKLKVLAKSLIETFASDISESLTSLRHELVDGVPGSIANHNVSWSDAVFDAEKTREHLCKVATAAMNQKVKRWQSARLKKIIDKYVETKGPMQVPAFRGIAAMASSKGLKWMPDIKAVQRWLDSTTDREQLFDLYEAVNGFVHPCRSCDIDDPVERGVQLGKSANTFLATYKRSLKSLSPANL